MIFLILIIVAIIGLVLGGGIQFAFLSPDPLEGLNNLFRIIYGVITMMGGVALSIGLMTLWSFKRFRAKLLGKPYHVEFVNYPNELYRVDIIGSPTNFTLFGKNYGIGALLHGKYGWHNWDDWVPIDVTALLEMPWTVTKIFSSDIAHDMVEDQTLIRVEQARRRLPIGSTLIGFGVVIAIIVGVADLTIDLSLRDLMIQGFNIIINQLGIGVEPPPIGGAPDIGGG